MFWITEQEGTIGWHSTREIRNGMGINFYTPDLHNLDLLGEKFGINSRYNTSLQKLYNITIKSMVGGYSESDMDVPVQDTTSSENEYPIDMNSTLLYGQKIGKEIKNYNIFFLPISLEQGIVGGSITDKLLSILEIDSKSISFNKMDLEEKRL